MRTETIFDRVPGCGDLKKAKRAANRLVKDWQNARCGYPPAICEDPRRFARYVRRDWREKAMLKP